MRPSPREDEDLGSYLRRIGFSEKQLRYVQRSFANAEGERMEWLNAAAHLQLPLDASGKRRGWTAMAKMNSDYRILDGYDSYYERLADGLDIRLGCDVQGDRLDRWRQISRETAVLTFAADAAVITLPLGVLQAGSRALLRRRCRHEARGASPGSRWDR